VVRACRPLTTDEADLADVGPMWVVEFPGDGGVMLGHVFADELAPLTPEEDAARDRVAAARAAERAAQTITITMEETCHYSYTYTVADLAERLGCEATPEAVHAALNGDDLADDDAVDEALNDHMEQSGFDYSEGRRYKNDAAALLA
jgi:hypothetical protein